ncbi:transposase [Nocardia sp. NPDC059691]|uniref:transposase n=1 Tax=Nocardia sp. NPDC059691 TaxID=3346908 RepID=UPI0036B53518
MRAHACAVGGEGVSVIGSHSCRGLHVSISDPATWNDLRSGVGDQDGGGEVRRSACPANPSPGWCRPALRLGRVGWSDALDWLSSGTSSASRCVTDEGRRVADVARAPGVTEATLYRWKRQALVDRGRAPSG